MPFEKRTVMEQKEEFVKLAASGLISISELCRRFNISRPTGYKWLGRYIDVGIKGLEEKSRRPTTSPNQTCVEIESQVISFRKENPTWGAKKIYHLLKRAGMENPPAKSTIHAILRRHGLIRKEDVKNNKWTRFEHPEPNVLWQMDFKGYFPLLNQALCHPLTMMDDHSRFNLLLKACKYQNRNTVKNALTDVFRRYGLPEMILCDNGSPWGIAGNKPQKRNSITMLEKWLIRLNIKPIHGKPYHPQTQGKEERFHRTLKNDLLNYHLFKDHDHCQKHFDQWRHKYNHTRPHESLDFQLPIERYKPSTRSFPEVLAPIEYDVSDQIRKVCQKGFINFKGNRIRVGKAFSNDPVAIRPTTEDGIFEIYFCNYLITKINLKL